MTKLIYKKIFFLLLFFFSYFLIFSQEKQTEIDSSATPIIPVNKPDFAKNINVVLDMRFDFLNHFENKTDPEDFTEFRNSIVALGISGKVHERVSFTFRNRYNRETAVQSLDMLGGSIEMAYVDVSLSPKFNLQLGKMFAYFGGYEYEFNPLYVLEYNDIQDNLLNYVTGLGVKYQLSDKHSFGFQALNSRTMTFEDLFEGNVSEKVKEPKWPLALVANWEGSFFDGLFETKYSFSRFRIAKGHATTTAFTLGNKFEYKNFKLMYDFNYDYEELDTKGIITNISEEENIANDVIYIEHWIRSEYDFSEHFTGLLTLMTSNAYTKNIPQENSGTNRIRTSYGVVPTIYYKPFKNLNLQFYAAYIGRFYKYSNFAHQQLDVSDYTTGEFRLGLIAPLLIL